MIKKFFILLLAIVASVGMSYALNPRSGDSWDDNTKTLTVNSNPQDDRYNDQSEIKRLVISSSVTEIGEQAFSNNYNLQEVIAYAGLQVIDQSAFFYCPNLESVILPSTLREVRYSAFAACDKLKYVTINASSLEDYAEYAFDDTHADLKIYVPEASLATYKTFWPAYASKFQAIPSSLAVGDTLKVGDAMYSATDVYVSAGYLCFQIKASSLHTISAIAPNGNGKIKVEITPYAEEFYPSGSYAALTNWFYCPSDYSSGDVTEITVVSGAGTLADPFIIDYVQPAAPAGPAWVKAGDEWDDATKTLTVNSNPGSEAYYQNTQIEHLIISDGVTTIGESAFDECTALLSVVIGNDVTNIEANAFDECGAMTSLTIGNKVQTIGESAFGSCESLTSVIIPNSVTSIGNSAFNTCDKISSLTIGSSVQTIGESAFKNCSMLTDVTIPASVESIGAWFFRNCENLATITCEATTPPTLGNNAFFDCDKLEHIYVPAASVATYKAATNWSDSASIISAAGGSAPTVTWNSSNVSNLTVNGNSYSKEGVTLGPNANNYAYWLDYGNESQNGIYFYVNATGGHTFSNSLGKNFTKIEMTLNGSTGWYVAYLGSGWNIDGMKVIWTGNASTVDLLTETSSFGGAAGVKSIVFYFEGGSEDPAPANSCGDGLTWELNGGVLTISYDGVGTGEMTDFGYEYDESPVNVAPWKENKSEITTVIVGDGVKSIGNYAFNDLYENFTAVTIANSVERIGVSAFMNAKWITEMTLPSSLKTIDEQCFAANFGFTSITIPSGVTSIGYRAFCYCTALTSLTCEATTPPTLASGVFYKIRSSTSSISSIPLYVPSESVAAYTAAAQWNAFDVQAIPGGGSTDVIPCTAEDLGKVLCTDGSIYATVSEAAAASKTAAAVIAYVDTQNGKALALALADDGEMLWATAKTTAPAHTPAVSHGTWKLPSKDDWNNMITAAGSYTALRDGFSAVGGTNMQEDAYWSSTPENDNAWIFYFAYGGKWVDGYVDDPSYVRACLEFDIPAAPAYETVMNLINAISTVELTAECKAKIDAARTAYDALNDGDKGQVTNIATLTTAEAAFDNVMNIWLSGDCDVILWNDTTLTVRKHAGEGNGAMADYNYMSRAPWYSSHWTSPQPNDIVIKSVTIEEGVTHLGDYAFAWMSEMKTLTIPSSVTTIPEDAFFWSKAVDDIYLHTNPSDLMWVLPTSADNQFKPEKGTNAHVPVDLLPAYQEWLNTLNVTYVGDQTPTVLTLEVGRIFNDSDEVYIGPDTTYIQFNCFASDKYLFGKGTFKIIGDEFIPGEVFGIKFEPKSMSYCFMSNAKGSAAYGTNCCATAKPTSMTVVSGDGTKANPFIIEPDTKGECVQAEWTTLPQAVSEITYDGQPHTLVVAGVSSFGTVQYSLDNGTNWSAELPQGTDPVTYTVHYRVNNGGDACIQGIDYDPNNKVTVSIVAPAVENVKAKIAAIPQPVVYTPACEEAIAEARSAYDALDDELKPFVENDDVLTAAEATYNNMKYVSAVVAKINNIPQPVKLKLATRDSIQNARAAYDALTADQKALVPAAEYQKLLDAEAALAALNPGGGMPAGVLSGKFTINADGDQIAFAKGNLQATTTDLGANWTWGFAANQWDLIGNAAANNAVSGNKTVSENGTVDLFGWSTPTTYYGIHNSKNSDYYSGDFREWGENITGATWKTPSPNDWIYIISNRADAAQKQGQATVNGVNGYIFLPDEWELPTGLSFTAKPNNWTANVYDGDDWTAMENAGAVFLPKSPWRSENTVATITYGYYWSSDYNNYSNAMAYYFKEDASITGTGTPRYAGICVRLVTAGGGGATPLDSAQAVKDLIDAIPVQVTLDDACVNAIEAARAAYDALSEAAQGALDAATVKKLTDAEDALTALNQAEADKAIAKINAIPSPVTLKLATRDAINNARAAYDALNAAQHALVTNYQKLTDAEDAWALIYPGHEDEMVQAEAVAALIEAIPDPVVLTSECENAINLANDAFSQLSNVQKAMLGEPLVQKLTDAVATYKVLADQDAADAVIARIDAIPSLVAYNAECKEAISDARAAYDALSDEAKALVSADELKKLTDAEAAYAALAAEIEFNVAFLGKEQSVLYEETIALTKLPNGAPDENGWAFDHWEVMPTPMYAGLHLQAVYRYLITLLPQAYDTLMYNGLAQTLIAAGEAEEGHLEYRIGEGAWSTELPKATNAGAYAIQYKLVREGHEDFIAPDIVTAEIAKAPVAYIDPVAYDTLVYNYAEQELVIAGQTEDGTFEYTLTPTNENSWSTILSQGMNAGTYNVYFRVIGDMNHLDSVAPNPVAVSIAKRDIIVTAPVAYDTLVYNALAQTLAADAIADFSTPLYSLTPDNIDSWTENMVTGVNAGDYKVYYRVPGDDNHNDFETDSIIVSIAKAPLTITANDTAIIYAEATPAFTASYSGWYGQDGADLISGLQFTTPYLVGSYVGTYDIVPSGATADNYTMTYVNGTLTVNKAVVSVIGAEAQKAKFADGHAIAVVLNQGTLSGIKLSDPLTHVTTATFSSAEVSENLTITLFYELTGDDALLANYDLQPTSKIYATDGVIIEPFIPNDEHQPEEDEQVEVKEGIDVYAYGYCDGNGYYLKYHLNTGYPDQYKIEFDDSRFTNVAYGDYTISGRDGTIAIDIPMDMPTGDYTMTVTFRDSRFPWLESSPFNVTFHVNLPETYVTPLFGNVIALVDTCNCFTDIQWYHRNNSTDLWQPIEGATGHYYHVDGKLTGEYFVHAKMNGEPTYTCGQADMETLYGQTEQNAPQLRAYPNPVLNTTTVTIENTTDDEHNMRIVNMMGVELMNTHFQGHEKTVDMSGYVQGNYMISVDGIVVKVVKQ